MMIGDYFIFILNSDMGRLEDLKREKDDWEKIKREVEYLITFKYCIHCMMKTVHGIFRLSQRGLCCFKAPSTLDPTSNSFPFFSLLSNFTQSSESVMCITGLFKKQQPIWFSKT